MSVEAYFDHQTNTLSASEPKSEIYLRCRIEYLNEGGANFIFKILPLNENESSLPSTLERKVLRLRKDCTHVQSATKQLEAFNKHFRPLFPASNLIQQTLVNLSLDLPSLLNNLLKNAPRSVKRQGDFLAEDESHGLLITDMSTPPNTATERIFLELKPKWLSQSPSAPREARRCRTCALRALRASSQSHTATDAQAICPLALVSSDVDERGVAARTLTGDRELQGLLIEGEVRDLLLRLRVLQEKFDPKGVLSLQGDELSSESGRNRDEERGDDLAELCKAMTLRDCTLFVRGADDGRIEARLGDLDLKMPEKLSKWRSIEDELIRDGWYNNAEVEGTREEENVCLLAQTA